MPEVAKERTSWRDEEISQWHRTLGWDCPAIDMDFLLLEYDRGVAVAFIEYKRETAPPQNLKHPSYKAMTGVADAAKLPFFIVRYAGDRSWFRVRAVNKYAKKYLPVPELLSEVEYITFLYRLRGRTVPPDVLVGRAGSSVQLEIEKQNLKDQYEQLRTRNIGPSLSKGAAKTFVFLFFLLALLFGCKDDRTPEQRHTDYAAEIEYFRDERTGLCFARVEQGSGTTHVLSVTCVPCDSVARVLAGGGR